MSLLNGVEIRARVSERTRGSLLMTLDTVFGETLARSATSLNGDGCRT